MIVFHVLLHMYSEKMPDAALIIIPAGFVLFAGVLIGRLLAGRKTWFQLSSRGLKLLLLFLAINSISVLSHRMSVSAFAVTLFSLDPSVVSFEILVPIGWTIVAAPIFLQLPPALIIIVAFGFLLGFDAYQWFPYAPKFFLIGCLGLGLGRQASLWPLLEQPRSWSTIVVAAIISILFYCFLVTVLPNSLVIQVMVLLSVYLWLPRWIVLMPLFATFMRLFGRYSLLLYLFHVTLISLAARLPVTHTSSIPVVLLEIVAVVIASAVFAMGVNAMVRRIPLAKRMYRLVFV